MTQAKRKRTRQDKTRQDGTTINELAGDRGK